MLTYSAKKASLLIILGAVVAVASTVARADQDMPTPPRISMVEGAASFWRPGAPDWAPAQLNTPLAPGDALFTSGNANIEIQVGPRAYVRMAGGAMLSLVNQEPDFQQFKVTSGIAAFDTRVLPAGRNIEIDTPNAAFAVDATGYYRVEVTGDVTRFIVRRGGRASVTLANGQTHSLAPSEEVVVSGRGSPNVETYVAPELDAWDRWNYARTDHFAEAISHRYIPTDVYGADDLDHYGDWRVVDTYGAVWVPRLQPAGWAPYATGSWVWDPRYGWTWVDQEPWGWAPYHYGRWISLDGYWAWAPGPRVRRSAYAPALVAFFRVGGGTSVQAGFNGPGVSWVALGWGEPVVPWWGGPAVHGKPSWNGWGGPRVVNNVVVRNATTVNITNISYRNEAVPGALLAARNDAFGKGRVEPMRIGREQRKDLAHIAGAPPVQAGPASLVVQKGIAAVPPASVISRPTEAMQPARQAKLPWVAEDQKRVPMPAAETHVISRPTTISEEPTRPSFGKRSILERPQPSFAPSPPRREEITNQKAVPVSASPSVPVVIPKRITASSTGAPTTAVAPFSAERERGAVTQERRSTMKEAKDNVMASPAQASPERIHGTPAPERHQAKVGAENRGAASPPTTTGTTPRAPARETHALPGQPANRLYPAEAKQ